MPYRFCADCALSDECHDHGTPGTKDRVIWHASAGCDRWQDARTTERAFLRIKRDLFKPGTAQNYEGLRAWIPDSLPDPAEYFGLDRAAPPERFNPDNWRVYRWWHWRRWVIRARVAIFGAQYRWNRDEQRWER